MIQFLLRLFYSVIGSASGGIAGLISAIIYLKLFTVSSGERAIDYSIDGIGDIIMSIPFLLVGSIIGLVCGILFPIYLARRHLFKTENNSLLLPIILGVMIGWVTGLIISFISIILLVNWKYTKGISDNELFQAIIPPVFIFIGSITGLLYGCYLAKRRLICTQQMAPVAIEDAKVWPPPPTQ